VKSINQQEIDKLSSSRKLEKTTLERIVVLSFFYNVVIYITKYCQGYNGDFKLRKGVMFAVKVLG